MGAPLYLEFLEPPGYHPDELGDSGGGLIGWDDFWDPTGVIFANRSSLVAENLALRQQLAFYAILSMTLGKIIAQNWSVLKSSKSSFYKPDGVFDRDREKVHSR